MEKESYLEDVGGTPSKTIKPRSRESGPDGRAAWIAAFAAFVINLIMAGLSRMSGILYVEFIEMFQIDRKGASMPFSVRSSTMNLLGPVVGIIGQNYSVRFISLVGGVLGTLSAAACFFVEEIGWITVIWGGVNGVGTALATTLITVVLSQYFKRHGTTASGMAFSGGCVGSFIFPPLVENLLHLYGLQGTFLIIAGIIMHCIPAAMILRKPQWVKKARRRAAGDVESLSRSSTLDEDQQPKHVDMEYLRKNRNVVLGLLDSEPSKETPGDEVMREIENVHSFVGKTPVAFRVSETMRVQTECEKSPASRTRSLHVNFKPAPIASPKSSKPQCSPFILRKMGELRGKSDSQVRAPPGVQRDVHARVLKELRMLHKLYEIVRRRDLFCSVGSRVKPSQEKKEATGSTIWDSIKNSVRLHSNPVFVLISLCRAVHFTTFVPVITIIVDYVMDKGLLEEDGKYVIAALSIGDLVGRLCFGWVTDHGYMTLPRYMLLVMILQGTVTAAIPFLDTMVFILPIIALYALMQGSVFVRHTVLVTKYMRSDEQSIAMGCVNFFAGILGFAVPSYVGFFRDTMGSYDGIFYVNGIIGALTGLLWIFEPYFSQSSQNDMPVEHPEV